MPLRPDLERDLAHLEGQLPALIEANSDPYYELIKEAA